MPTGYQRLCVCLNRKVRGRSSRQVVKEADGLGDTREEVVLCSLDPNVGQDLGIGVLLSIPDQSDEPGFPDLSAARKREGVRRAAAREHDTETGSALPSKTADKALEARESGAHALPAVQPPDAPAQKAAAGNPYRYGNWMSPSKHLVCFALFLCSTILGMARIQRLGCSFPESQAGAGGTAAAAAEDQTREVTSPQLKWAPRAAKPRTARARPSPASARKIAARLTARCASTHCSRKRR